VVLTVEAMNIFNAMHEGILIIDTEERIVFGNTAYRRFLEREAGGEIGPIEGYFLRDLRPGAQLPRVLRTGKPILQAPRRELEDVYFVNMYPVFDGHTVVGGLSVVTFMEEASAFQKTLEELRDHSEQVLRRVNRAAASRYTFDDVVANGQRSRTCKELAIRLAASEAPVLLTAESGAGKEVYAQAIHNLSPRRAGVFTSVNCAAFQQDALEAELFGTAEGSFAGKRQGGKVGLFEACRGGTLFLDELSEMNLHTQSMLLRTLQERTVRPAGGAEEVPVDVRVIAAANADLEEYIRQGRFRSDLYYQLNTFRIQIPPLRERIEDLPELTARFLADISTRLKREITITDGAVERLMAHSWPGNIRELRNVLEFSAYLSQSGTITEDGLPENISLPPLRDTTPLYERVRKFERGEIRKALDHYGESLAGKRAAAEELGISLASLYSKLKEE